MIVQAVDAIDVFLDLSSFFSEPGDVSMLEYSQQMRYHKWETAYHWIFGIGFDGCACVAFLHHHQKPFFVACAARANALQCDSEKHRKKVVELWAQAAIESPKGFCCTPWSCAVACLHKIPEQLPGRRFCDRCHCCGGQCRILGSFVYPSLAGKRSVPGRRARNSSPRWAQ